MFDGGHSGDSEDEKRTLFVRVEDVLVRLPWFTLVGAVIFPLFAGVIWSNAMDLGETGYNLLPGGFLEGLLGVGALSLTSLVLFWLGSRKREQGTRVRIVLSLLYGLPGVLFVVIFPIQVARLFIG